MAGGGGGGGGGATDLTSLTMAIGENNTKITENMMSIMTNSEGISTAMNSFGLLTF